MISRMLPSRQEYENFIYTLPDAYPSIKVSTLRLIPTGAKAGRLVGTVTFDKGIEPRVFEAIDFAVGGILDYGYSVSIGGRKRSTGTIHRSIRMTRPSP